MQQLWSRRSFLNNLRKLQVLLLLRGYAWWKTKKEVVSHYTIEPIN